MRAVLLTTDVEPVGEMLLHTFKVYGTHNNTNITHKDDNPNS